MRERVIYYSRIIMINVMVVSISVLLVLTLMTTINANGVYGAAKPAVNADSAIVVSGSTGEVVLSKHSKRKLPPGGAVKLMTAIVTVNKMHDDKELDNVVQITRGIDKAGDIFAAGDKVTVRDLLYTMLMTDSDEAAKALAIYTSGEESDFVEAMNLKAKELGLIDTNFTNVTGEYSQKQYSTAADVADALREACDYSIIEEILEAKSYTVKIDGKTKNLSLKADTGVKVEGLRISNSAGARNTNDRTYYGMAVEDGMHMIVVMFSEPKGDINKDAAQLFKYGFANVTRQVIVKADKNVGSVRIRHGAKTRVPVYTESKGYVYIPKEGSDSLIRTETVYRKGLEAPIKAGTKVGEYKIYVADEYQGKVDLVVKDDVPVGWFPSYIYISNLACIITGIIIVVLLALLIRLRIAKKKRDRLRRQARQKKIREMARREYEIEQDRIRRNWTYR